MAGAARVALLAGPTALAFFQAGYYENARLVAGIVVWVLVLVLALCADGGGVPEASAPPPTGRDMGTGRRRRVPWDSLLPRTTAVWLALGGLLGFTVWVWLSRTWAPLAGPAGDDVQRDALYLGALVAGAIAWKPRAWARNVEVALAGGVLIVIGYGVLGRVLPGLIDLKPSFYAGGRLDQPLTYWNAMGAISAIGFVLTARIAGDITRPAALRAGGAAAAIPMALALYLTYSRGALSAVACGLLVLMLLTPTWSQLRATVLLVVGGGLASAICSRLDGVASLSGSMAHRERQGLVMLAVLVVLVVAVALVQLRAQHETRTGTIPLGRWVRPAGYVVAIAVALLPYALAVVSERGEDNPSFGASAQRLASTGSNRYAYWRVAFRTFLDHPLKGAGASSFRVEWLRERPFRESVRDAHSLYFETLAELGLVGFVLLCALLAGVLLAVRKVLAVDPALVAGPGAALVVWAVHAGVDWDWEMPALTLVAVTLAGMLLAQCERVSRPAPQAPAA